MMNLFQKLFGRSTTAKSASSKKLTRRSLKLESLEERQLLSAVGWETSTTYGATDLYLDTVSYGATTSETEGNTVTFAFFYDNAQVTAPTGVTPVEDTTDIDGFSNTNYYYLLPFTGDGDIATQTFTTTDAVPNSYNDNVYINGLAYDGAFTEITKEDVKLSTNWGFFKAAQLGTPVLEYDSNTADSITLTWDKVQNTLELDTEFGTVYYTEYDIRYSTTANFDYEDINVGFVGWEIDEAGKLTSTLKNAEVGTTYYFKAQAYDNMGSEYSEISAEYSFKLLATPEIDSENTSKTNDSVTIQWNAIEGASSYEYRFRTNTDPESDWSTPVSVDDISVVVSNLTENTEYDFQVRAVGAAETAVSAEYSAWSATANATTMTKLAPAPVLTVDTTSTTPNSISVSWTAPENAQTEQTYTLEYAVKPETGDPVWITVGSAITETSATVNSLDVNTTYLFQVKANTIGEFYESDYSIAQEATTDKLTMTLTVTSYSGAYDGLAHGVTLLATDAEENELSPTYYYRASETEEWSLTPVTGTNVADSGTVYVKAELADYYDATGNGTITITAIQLTISGTIVADKVYDGNAVAEVTANGTLDGFVNEEICNFTVEANFDNKDVAYDTDGNVTTKVVTAAYALDNSAVALNYLAPENATLSATINPAQLETPAFLLDSPTATIAGFTAAWNDVANAGSYTLSYKLASENTAIWTEVADITDTEYTVSGLTEGEIYNVTIQAVATPLGNYSDSAISAVSNVTTLKTVPLPEEEEVIAEDESSDSIVISWVPVENPTDLGVTGYVIEYTVNEPGAEPQYMTVDDPTAGTAVIDNLDPETEYTISVYANTSATSEFGNTLLGEPIIVTTDPVPPVANPQWNVANQPFNRYFFDVQENVATLYARTPGGMVVVGTPATVSAESLPEIFGGAKAESFVISSDAQSFFEQINVYGAGTNSLCNVRDNLILIGSEADNDVEVNDGKTADYVNGRTIYGTGIVSISENLDGEIAKGADVNFGGMKNVVASAKGAENVFTVNTISAQVSFKASQDSRNTLDLQEAQVINPAGIGAILNLNSPFAVQTIVGQVGRFRLATPMDRIIGTEAVDMVYGGGSNAVNFADISGSRNVINLVNSTADNTIEVVGDYQVIITGQGNDNITVSGDYCSINAARGGDNQVELTGDFNTYIGGAGNDQVDLAGNRNNISTMGGDDIVWISDAQPGVTSGGNIVNLGNGNDVLLAQDSTGNQANYFYAGTGNDVIIGSQATDYIYGQVGESALIGQGGADYIFGSSNNDILAGDSFDALETLLNNNESTIGDIMNLIGQVANANSKAAILAASGNATSDNAKDYLYRSGGNNHVFFASKADDDFVNSLNVGNFNDIVIFEDEID